MDAAKHINEGYVLGHSDQEMERLEQQGKYLYPFTRDLLIKAGITKGMRVLDMGAGSGDVSIIASELVGETGVVYAVDRSADIIGVGKRRMEFKGIKNVTFIQGDQELEIAEKANGKFDAVIGRLFLIHLPNPIETLCGLTKHLVPGGIVAFHEIDMGGTLWTEPVMPTYHRIYDVIVKTVKMAGMKEMGIILRQAFDEAGIVGGRVIREGIIEHGSKTGVYSWVAGFLRSMLPLTQKFGIATAEEIQIDTLAQRMQTECVELNSYFIPVNFVCAYGRLPQAEE